MDKEKFIKEVEFLLSDISNEEKLDAINYYRDYLEEAGPEKEEEVLKEFGSPERIAAIIRADLAGNMADGGEFTENGYEDPRFDEPEQSMVVSENDTKEENDSSKFSYEEPVNNKDTKSDKKDKKSEHGISKTGKIVLIICLVLLLSPVLLGTGGLLFGLFGSVLGVVLAVLFALAIATVGLFIFAVGSIVSCIGFVFVNGHIAILLFGLAFAAAGLGLLALVLSVLFYGKFIPFLFRKIKGLFAKKEA